MGGFKVYKSILAFRSARIFDIAGFCMRFYGYMMNIGVVTMLTLAGYSFIVAGLVSSVIALSVFVVSPRIGKLADERGQHIVVPIAAAITLAGLAGMLATTQMHGEEWLLFVFAIPMGFLPSAQALVRARWTYLLRTGALGSSAPEVKTIFSYEGVIDDIGFMLGPPASIAISTALFPTAGLLTGGILFAIGATVLTFCRSTEPVPGWEAKGAGDVGDVEAASDESGAGALGYACDNRDASDVDEAGNARVSSMLVESPVIRVLFSLMFFVGAFYGTFDTSGVAFAEGLGNPNIASVALMISSVISILVGIVFGMVHIRIAMYKQVLVIALLMGLSYGTLMLVDNVPSFYVVSIVGAVFYSPLLITLNSACERSVPGKRLTESIAWINAGCTLGLAAGPTVAGFVVDTVSPVAGFDLGGAIAICVPLVAIMCYRILKRNVRDDAYEVLSISNT